MAGAEFAGHLDFSVLGRIPSGATDIVIRIDSDTERNRLVRALDAKNRDRLTASGLEPDAALARIDERKSSPYRARLTDRLRKWSLGHDRYSPDVLSLDRLRAGMLVDQDVHAAGGILLLGRGQQITGPILERLGKFAAAGGIDDPIRILVQRQSRD